MELKTNAVLITGPLAEADVKELLEALRVIERRKPQEMFMLHMVDDVASAPETRAFIERIFPAIKGVPVEISRFEKQ